MASGGKVFSSFFCQHWIVNISSLSLKIGNLLLSTEHYASFQLSRDKCFETTTYRPLKTLPDTSRPFPMSRFSPDPSWRFPTLPDHSRCQVGPDTSWPFPTQCALSLTGSISTLLHKTRETRRVIERFTNWSFCSSAIWKLQNRNLMILLNWAPLTSARYARILSASQ